MKNTTHFFLGANSADGFYSLYDQLLDAQLDDLMIIKGGPGCGKSTLMKHLARAAQEQGEDVVYIHCSGDPDSLDAAIFPRLRKAIVDGTSPHVLEPNYTGVCERYLDLSPFYDVAGVKTKREEIVAMSDAYRASYAKAFHVLRAMGEMESERRAIVCAHFDERKLLRRAVGIAARELKGEKEESGRAARVFLGGVTHQGILCRFDSVEALCPRIYALEDTYGLAAPLLRYLQGAAMEAGDDVLICPNPERPSEVQHLLIPARGLAFVTTNERQSYSGKPYRRIRIDAMAEEKLTRAQKAHLRFLRRIRRALEEEAVTELKNAKREHDALEALYHPYVDFSGVEALGRMETARLFDEK